MKITTHGVTHSFKENDDSGNSSRIFDVIVILLTNAVVAAFVYITPIIIPFVTSEFETWLPYAFLAIGVGVICQIITLAPMRDRTRHSIILVQDILSGISIYMVYRIYPFDVYNDSWFERFRLNKVYSWLHRTVGEEYLDLTIRVILIILFVGIIVGTLGRIIKILRGEKYGKVSGDPQPQQKKRTENDRPVVL